jgi:hypothetical protein
LVETIKQVHADWKRATDGSEYEYIAKVMDYPSRFHVEMIPKGKIIKYWLLVVFDAFEEICQRMKG